MSSRRLDEGPLSIERRRAGVPSVRIIAAISMNPSSSHSAGQAESACEATKPPWPVRWLLGVPLDALTMQRMLSIVDDTIRERKRLLIGVVNAAKIVNMHRDAELGAAVRAADLILADGISVVLASRVLRRRLPERVPGIDLMTHMLELADERGYRVYCLGATQEVLDTVLQRIAARYPGAVVVGSHHGYFTDQEDERIAEDIQNAKPDMLFAAMSSPKKERFLARWSGQMDVPVCHGVGGAFDVMAGKVKRAPELWQRLGMEWLYRVVQEPRRMWRRYLVTNTLFCWMVLCQFCGRKYGPRP
jgi:N-acetylglucosaminyldiphosphoundecaprenol N-acetyl-beta-D-mannosaminyltransferase